MIAIYGAQILIEISQFSSAIATKQESLGSRSHLNLMMTSSLIQFEAIHWLCVCVRAHPCSIRIALRWKTIHFRHQFVKFTLNDFNLQPTIYWVYLQLDKATFPSWLPLLDCHYNWIHFRFSDINAIWKVFHIVFSIQPESVKIIFVWKIWKKKIKIKILRDAKRLSLHTVCII